MKKISKILKKEWVVLVVIVLGLVLGVYLFQSPPDKMPIHFNY
jgi:uncharacterized membrane protein